MRGFKGYVSVLSRVKRNSSAPGGKSLSGVANASIGFYTVWIVHLGRRYGILEAFSRRKRPAGTKSIAHVTHLAERAVQVWCEAARSLGVIDGKRGGYRLPAKHRALLADPYDLRFLGGQFSYLALRSLDFEAFDDFFRRGEAGAAGVRHLREAADEATRWDHTSFLKFLLPCMPKLSARLRAGARVLDVGCGTGGWTFRMADAFPRSSFTGIDPDRKAIRIAGGKVRGGDRICFRVANGGEPRNESAPFDIAYLGEVLYGVGDKVGLLRNVKRSLAANGTLVLAEGLVTPPRRTPDPAAQLVAAMGLDFALQGARFFEKPELESLLRKAGFRRVEFHDAGGGLWFVVANAGPKQGGSERRGAARRARGDR